MIYQKCLILTSSRGGEKVHPLTKSNIDCNFTTGQKDIY